MAAFFRISVGQLADGMASQEGVLEFRDHEAPQEQYDSSATAAEVLEKLYRRNRTLYESLKEQIVAVERWDAQKRKRKRMK